MRFLHTSDWHLGQTLHSFERVYEHQCFLDWLLQTLVDERIDALLIAGDVYDNANPSAASQKQLYRFLRQAKSAVRHLNIVIIAGNHDSPGRLEAPGPLLEEHDVSLVGNVLRDAAGAIALERLVLPLKNRDGEIAAWCLAVPFLRPGDVPRVDSADPYAEGIALLYRQALALALEKRSPGQAIVALGHCHMTGGAQSADSERRVIIGGSEALSAAMFGPEVAYAALGHLHLAQVVGKQPHLRYSGSPLPMSFSEIPYRHQVLRFDLDGERATDITPLHVPRTVDLLRVPATPGPLDEVLAALQALPPRSGEHPPYLEVRVRLDAPEPGLRARVEAALEGRHARLARIDTSLPQRGGDEAETLSLDQIDSLRPDDIFRRLYRQKFDRDAPDDQLSAFTELMTAAGVGPAA
ncbi:exonuclease SbcCD subunit D C-terminal domain-containing protein [Noviherbaspirillum suwonense]|uniref:Nuclease SbcCD subunit D n=1 Tax=Noviherbaspirillum suwonense TaxID=1224511 RepID=A0ABY1PUY6_9BURK|nr:exonuclease SbcCD subunit D C-terminal domain-containing protein [Noviherbaspirillum suwonense]SMP49578.1 Exodeoxyribonuclease I subunit D [Noviherbaspirillum suwonense]